MPLEGGFQKTRQITASLGPPITSRAGQMHVGRPNCGAAANCPAVAGGLIDLIAPHCCFLRAATASGEKETGREVVSRGKRYRPPPGRDSNSCLATCSIAGRR